VSRTTGTSTHRRTSWGPGWPLPPVESV